MVTRRLFLVTLGLGCMTLSACGAPPPPGESEDVARLAGAIRGLGGQVDAQEARRAAQLAYRHTHDLALQYGITDPPLIHNTKVNMGLRPRGLCWHWARDMEHRLRQEEFETLDLHRAVANADNRFRLEHSTAIISARGAPYEAGIVLDPWRKGGRLTWARVADDDAYHWEPRNAVVARKLERQHGQIVTLTEDQRILMAGREFAAQ